MDYTLTMYCFLGGLLFGMLLGALWNRLRPRKPTRLFTPEQQALFMDYLIHGEAHVEVIRDKQGNIVDIRRVLRPGVVLKEVDGSVYYPPPEGPTTPAMIGIAKDGPTGLPSYIPPPPKWWKRWWLKLWRRYNPDDYGYRKFKKLYGEPVPDKYTSAAAAAWLRGEAVHVVRINDEEED